MGPWGSEGRLCQGCLSVLCRSNTFPKLTRLCSTVRQVSASVQPLGPSYSCLLTLGFIIYLVVKENLFLNV